jgi:hypothetical protein
MQRAPRVALELDGRPVPVGMLACHACDNPQCVNPAHLCAGTPKQNTKDALERNRLPRGERHYTAKRKHLP